MTYYGWHLVVPVQVNVFAAIANFGMINYSQCRFWSILVQLFMVRSFLITVNYGHITVLLIH